METDPPILGVLLGFVMFGCLVYTIYLIQELQRFDYKAFRAWFSWQLTRPRPQDYTQTNTFIKELSEWHSETPCNPVFRPKNWNSKIPLGK